MSDYDTGEECSACGQPLPPSFYLPPTGAELAKQRRDCASLLTRLIAAFLGVPVVVAVVLKGIQLVVEWVAGAA